MVLHDVDRRWRQHLLYPPLRHTSTHLRGWNTLQRGVQPTVPAAVLYDEEGFLQAQDSLCRENLHSQL